MSILDEFLLEFETNEQADNMHHSLYFIPQCYNIDNQEDTLND